MLNLFIKLQRSNLKQQIASHPQFEKTFAISARDMLKQFLHGREGGATVGDHGLEARATG